MPREYQRQSDTVPPHLEDILKDAVSLSDSEEQQLGHLLARYS